MKIPKSPARIAAWSLAVIATTYLLTIVSWTLRVVGTERINRRTQISLAGPELELKLNLPKGAWLIEFAENYEGLTGQFEAQGEHVRISSKDSEGLKFNTDKDFTKVIVNCRFEGDLTSKFVKFGATF